MNWDDHDVMNGFNSQLDIIRATELYTKVAEIATR
jgi:hypothetical protein